MFEKRIKLKKTEIRKTVVYLPEWFDYKWWYEFSQKHFKYRNKNAKYYYLVASVLYRTQNYTNKNQGISVPLASFAEKWEVSRINLGKIISALEKDGYITLMKGHNRFKKLAREYKYNYDLSNLKKVEIYSPTWNYYNNNIVNRLELIQEQEQVQPPKYVNYIKNLENWWFPTSSFSKLNYIDWSKTSEGRERSTQEIIDYKNMIKSRMNSWNYGNIDVKISEKCGRLFHTPNEINKKARILYRYRGNNERPVEIDINAAHLRILTSLLLYLDLEVEQEFIDLLNNADVYQYIADTIHKDRNTVKLAINSRLINSRKPSLRWLTNKCIKNTWPNLWNSLLNVHTLVKLGIDFTVNGKNYRASNLGSLCMQIESDLVLNVCEKLSIDHIPVLSIHDAILSLPKYVDLISEKLTNSWSRFWKTAVVKLKISVKQSNSRKLEQLGSSKLQTKAIKTTKNNIGTLVELFSDEIEVLSHSPP